MYGVGKLFRQNLNVKLDTRRIIGFERHARSIYLSFPCNISLARQIAGLFATWLFGRKTSDGNE